MADLVEVLNGDDRALTLAALKQAAKRASAANRKHLLAVSRSLNPHAARRRAFKGAPPMAQHKKAAGKKSGHKTNPTKKHHTKKHHGRRTNPTTVRFGGARHDLKSLVIEAGAVVAGQVGQSMAQRQVTRFFPTLSPTVSGLVSGGAIALGAHFLGSKSSKYSGIAKGVAVGALASAIRTAAASFAPSLFAGTDDDYAPSGLVMPPYYPQLSDGGMSGVVFEAGEQEPSVETFTDY